MKGCLKDLSSFCNNGYQGCVESSCVNAIVCYSECPYLHVVLGCMFKEWRFSINQPAMCKKNNSRELTLPLLAPIRSARPL